MMAGYWSEWRRTTDVIKWTRGCTYLPDCCACRRPTKETEVSVYRIKPGTPIRDIPYCTPFPKFRCAPGKGCNAEPWSRNGASLRHDMAWWDGQPAFIRKRDGKRLILLD